VHARKSIFGYRMMVWAILAIGGISFIVWAHHMYVSGMNPYFGFFFATTTLIIAIPTAIKVYNWVLTLWKGDIHLTVPMLFAIAFIFTFINGGLTGLFLGNVVVDLPTPPFRFATAAIVADIPSLSLSLRLRTSATMSEGLFVRRSTPCPSPVGITCGQSQNEGISPHHAWDFEGIIHQPMRENQI